MVRSYLTLKKNKSISGFKNERQTYMNSNLKEAYQIEKQKQIEKYDSARMSVNSLFSVRNSLQTLP